MLGQSGLTVAGLLGARIAIIGMKNGQQVFEEHIHAYGLSHRACSMHVVDVLPADLIESKPCCLDIINNEVDKTIQQHRAEVILFGCTAMSGYIDVLRATHRLPIIEPMACAINMAITLVNLGLSHCKLCYESPAASRSRSGQHQDNASHCSICSSRDNNAGLTAKNESLLRDVPVHFTKPKGGTKLAYAFRSCVRWSDALSKPCASAGRCTPRWRPPEIGS